MNLRKYDNKRVRVVDPDGTVFEGLAEYNSAEFNHCEMGGDEESIQISYFNFYKSTIKDIKIISEYEAPYGTLEKETVKDGIDVIDQVLSYEDENSERLKVYLKEYIKKHNNELTKQIKELLKEE